ncbi:MAG: hypothetical protein JSW25_09205 [Thermoplasmata archaeon]|nr:MAG: hypothetical protein JSW25_09205 [Thermoplasmata archaeon]
MTAERRTPVYLSMALMGLVLLALLVPPGGAEGGPPPYEPPAGYVPPEVDVRIVGLIPGQQVGVGTTHHLRAEALDEAGSEWGERFDWFVDGEHAAMGPEFSWTVTGPRGGQRVTLVVSSGDAAAWAHVDVTAGVAPQEPPSWLGTAVRAVPLVAVVFWLALVYRQLALRKGSGPPGSG